MSARKSFIWAAASQFIVFIVSFAGSVIVARILNPTEVGVYVIGAAFIGICTAATAFNLGAYVIGETELNENVLDCAFTMNLALSIIISIISLIGSVLSDLLFASKEAGSVMFFLAAQPVIGALAFRSLTMLTRSMHFKIIALINSCAMIVGTAVTVLSAFAHQSYMSQVWGSLTWSIVSSTSIIIAGRKYFSFRLSLEGWRALALFGGRMTTISGAALATARVTEVIIGRMLGLEALGVYARASSLSNQLWDNVYGTATRVAFVQLSKDFRETGELRCSFLRSFSLITGVMVPMLAALAVYSPYIIRVLYGERWLEAALPFSIMLMAQIAAMSFGMNWELFVIRRETARQTKIELQRNAAAVMIVSIGSLFSIAAACVGRLCDGILGFILYRKHVLRLSGVTSAEFSVALRDALILAFLAGLPGATVMALHRWSSGVNHWEVIISIITGISCWLVGVFTLRHPLKNEILFFSNKVGAVVVARNGH